MLKRIVVGSAVFVIAMSTAILMTADNGIGKGRATESKRAAIVVAGKVTGVDPTTSCRGAVECFAFPEIRLHVDQAYGVSAAGLPHEVVVDMQIPGDGGGEDPPPDVGDRIIVVVWTSKDVSAYACGRLRSCAEVPKQLWYGVDLYRVVRWP